MKKYLLIFMLIFVTYHAKAFECRNKLTGALIPEGNTDYSMPIDSNLVKGENIFGNVGDFLECRNTMPSSYVDFIYIERNGIELSSAFNEFEGGVYVNGVAVLAPNNQQVLITKLIDDLFHDIDLMIFLSISKHLDRPLVINAGDELMRLRIKKTSSYDGQPESDEDYYIWIFRANNRAVLESGTCTINHNNVLNVDFGNVPISKVKNQGEGLNSVMKEVSLDIDCEGVNKDVIEVKITLDATSSSFSSDAIVVKEMKNLGIELYHKNKLIAPFKSFTTTLFNGMSNDSVIFSVIKNKNGAKLEAGAFNASAALIVSLP